jgi:hypothetical protein
VKRLALLLATAGTLIAAALPALASAAPPQTLGQTATTYSGSGGCGSSDFQATDSGTNGYVVPSTGVLTKSQVYVGPFTQPSAGEWFRPQTFRTTGPTTAAIVSQGSKHVVEGLSAGGHYFTDRFPATAGDVLGARFNTSAFIEATPCFFPTASSSDQIGLLPGAEAGNSGTFTSFSSLRINIMATLEADQDGDGYGDSSQDLCPGSPVAAAACSGALFGSNFSGPAHSYTGGCGYACLRVQKTVDSQSTAAPFDGVVVRWRLLGAATGSYRVRVVQPGGGNYTILHSSEPGAVSTEPFLTEQMSTFPTRLPIPAGSYVALAGPTSGALGITETGATAKYETILDHVADGAAVPETGGAVNGAILYDADIEPDADHDGYGDVTQDACPSNGSTQGACPPSSGGGSGSSPKSSPAKKPEISGLKATPSLFRVKQGGAAISARSAHAGTTLKLTLSEKAKVAFTLQKSLVCKAPTKAKRCAAIKSASPLRLFTRDLPEGKSKIPFSGLYKSGKKVRALKPGSYTLTAVATNGTGKASAPSQTKLTVVGAP